MSKRDRSNTTNRIIVTLFFAVCWAILFLVYPYHLIYKEQLTLFACNRAYLSMLLAKPGFVAVAAGDFLTQMFLLTGGAATVTVLVAIIFWDGVRRALKSLGVEKNPGIFALIPAVSEIILSCILEYRLALPIGAAVSVWLFVMWDSTNNRIVRTVSGAVLLAAAYPLVGAHSLIFLILLAVSLGRKHIGAGITCLVAGLAIIFLEGWFYLLTPFQRFAYPLVEKYLIRNIYIFAITEVALILAVLLGNLSLKRCFSIPFIVLLSAGGFWMVHNAEEEYDLKISTLAYYGKWDRVLEMGLDNPLKTQTAAYYANLALAREGRLADGLLDRYQPLFYGLFLPVQSNESYLKVIASIDALLEAGDYAQAQHSALLGMTFTPNQRSSRVARKLVEISLANGDSTSASKYLNMLKTTLLHRKWAEQAEAVFSQENYSVQNVNSDILYVTNDYPAALRNTLDSNPNADHTAQYLLCYDLLTKDIMSFKSDYDKYYLPHNRGIIPPKVYQEALEMLEAGPEYCISPEVKEQNQDFLNDNHGRYQTSYWFYFLYAEPEEK